MVESPAGPRHYVWPHGPGASGSDRTCTPIKHLQRRVCSDAEFYRMGPRSASPRTGRVWGSGRERANRVRYPLDIVDADARDVDPTVGERLDVVTRPKLHACGRGQGQQTE